jgi:hypothetical protein
MNRRVRYERLFHEPALIVDPAVELSRKCRGDLRVDFQPNLIEGVFVKPLANRLKRVSIC